MGKEMEKRNTERTRTKRGIENGKNWIFDVEAKMA